VHKHGTFRHRARDKLPQCVLWCGAEVRKLAALRMNACGTVAIVKGTDCPDRGPVDNLGLVRSCRKNFGGCGVFGGQGQVAALALENDL
jgi:hypothetical protein